VPVDAFPAFCSKVFRRRFNSGLYRRRCKENLERRLPFFFLGITCNGGGAEMEDDAPAAEPALWSSAGEGSTDVSPDGETSPVELDRALPGEASFFFMI
jgi:hypothetical protein